MMRVWACALLITLSMVGLGMERPIAERTSGSDRRLRAPVKRRRLTGPTTQAPNDSRAGQNKTGETTKSSAGPAKKRRAPKHAAAPAGTPKKIIVREGGVDEPTAQIVTGMTPEAAARARNEAELLLATTAETLQEIAPRQLDLQQQETVSAIHNYMTVARSALKRGRHSPCPYAGRKSFAAGERSRRALKTRRPELETLPSHARAARLGGIPIAELRYQEHNQHQHLRLNRAPIACENERNVVNRRIRQEEQ